MSENELLDLDNKDMADAIEHMAKLLLAFSKLLRNSVVKEIEEACE